MNTIVFECQYCYIETIIKFDSEVHDTPRYCPYCGQQADDYEELEFRDD